MLNEDERNRLRVLSVQQNVPLRISSPTPQPQVRISQPTQRPVQQVRVTTPYIPPAPTVPQYQGIGARLRDIYQSDTAQDIAKRQIAGLPSTYREQKIQEGERPLSNIGTQVLATPLRLVNTVSSLGQQLPGLARIGAGLVTGNRPAALKAAQDVEQIQKRTLAPESGLFGVGTLVPSKQALEQMNIGDVAKLSAGAGAELSSFVIGGGALPSLLKIGGKQGLKKLASFVAKESLAGALGGGGSEITRRPDASAKDILTSAAVGVAIGAPTALGAGVLSRSLGNVLTTRTGRLFVNRLAEETDSAAIRDAIKEIAPNLANDELTALSREIAQATTPEEVQTILTRLASQETTAATRQATTQTAQKGAQEAVQAFENTAQQLARTNNQNAVRESVEALFPNLDNNTKTNTINVITQSSDPAVVTDALMRAKARSDELTQTIQGATPPVKTQRQQQAEEAQELVENPPIQSETPPPVTTPPESPTPAGVQDATFNAVDTKVPVPAEVTNYETLGGQFQRAFVDKDAPLLNYAKQLEKQTGEKGLVDQLYYVTGLQRRANAIANAEIRTNPNLAQALEGLDSTAKGEFDIYVAARNELSNASRGLPTSRPVKELKELVDNLGPEYGDRFTALNAYYQDWALKMRDAGLINEDTYQNFVKNQDYTRIQRVMDDLATPPTRGGASYSFGTPSARQKRKGSLREIQPADITAFDYAQRIQKEIQRNQTANTIIDLLQVDNAAKQIPASQAARKNVIKRVVDGQTQYWEVPRDIKELADNVTPFQLGVLAKVIAAPQRLLRAGVSGLSAPFTAVNFARDIVSSAVFSKNAKATHLNPLNILTGLKNASADTLGANLDNELWNKFISIAGDTTQFDFLRNVANAKEVSRGLRLGKLGKARNMAGSPIRTLEDLNTITERATRFSNFKGIYESVLKQTNDPNLALREATLAAWQNSVDFSRMGNVSQVINLLIPYFNAGIQGTRLLGRRLVENPVSTSGKILGLVGMPLVGATLYNVSDPKRKAIYDNISEYEKENNTIIVLPNAQQNEDGSYTGVIKIPLQPGLSNLVNPIRQVTELYAGQVPLPEAQKMLAQFMEAFSGPINLGSINGMLSSLTPQVIKPTLQQVMNKDLFTEREIVPEYIEEQVTASGEPIKESDKAYRYSSGTARFVGNRLGVSPIRVEKFIKDTTGKVGQYVINASDNILSKAGVIPNEQIGGISVKDDFTRRFVEAASKYNYKKSEGAQFYDIVAEATKGLSPNSKKAYDALHPQKTNILGEEIFDENKRIMKYARAGVYLQFPDVFEAERAIEMEQRKRGNPANPLYDLPPDQLTKVLLKAALPPGAKDPELSNLWQQEWYQDFNAKRDAYYTQLQAKLAAQGKSFPPQENPYPTTPPELQQVMNFYSSLPKGTGERSAWIRSNPTLWNQMTNQWAAVDAWENKERVDMGLSPVENLVQNAQQSGVRFGGTSPEYKAIMAALKELNVTAKPLEIISAAPRRNVRLARVRVPTSRRTPRIQLR